AHSIALGPCRTRRDREEGRCDAHQQSSTVFRTVPHRHTPWAKLPRHGTAPGFVRSLRRSASLTGFEAAFTQRLQPTFVLSVFDTPAREESLRRRFIWAARWASAMLGAG